MIRSCADHAPGQLSAPTKSEDQCHLGSRTQTDLLLTLPLLLLLHLHLCLRMLLLVV
jgi:hypothetical protein